MIEDIIVKLFTDKDLGSARPPITPVFGGYLHRMYKVNTESGSFAVKHLNPNIMKRPDSMGNFMRADAMEKMLEDVGISGKEFCSLSCVLLRVAFAGSICSHLGQPSFQGFVLIHGSCCWVAMVLMTACG